LNKKSIGLISTLFCLAILVVPVLAIGPRKAEEVGNNPNLTLADSRILVNHRGEASGIIYTWYTTKGFWEKWSFFDANDGQGKSNNVIEFDISTAIQYSADRAAFLIDAPTFNENKWIYLSYDGEPDSFQLADPMGLSHGAVWWFYFFNYYDETDPPTIPIAVSIANAMASAYPNGAYWSYNFVK
jgi:hypothetical protein